jgi:N-acyl-D-amino-acid deacylase
MPRQNCDDSPLNSRLNAPREGRFEICVLNRRDSLLRRGTMNIFKRACASLLACLGMALLVLVAVSRPSDAIGEAQYTLILRNGTIYDGSGGAPFVGDVAIAGDRIAEIEPHVAGHGAREIDVKGKAIAPGFINMLAHPEESLLADGRAQSDLRQGVTLEVMGEDSMGPVSPKMKALALKRQSDIKYAIDWSTLGEYMARLERHGIAVNVASFVGAGTVRTYVLGEGNVQPTPDQLAQMRTLVHQAMEEGALGVTTALMYVPNTFAKTPELIDLASESARCGGMYIAHIRSESDRVLESIQESIDIAKASGAPAEIYHFKQSGKDNWTKLDAAIAKVEAARAHGTRITADMYVYPAAATGLDAAMPPWVQDGGLEQWAERLKDPSIRKRVIAEMRNPHPKDWDSAYGAAGAGGVLFLNFKNPKLKPLIGKTLAEVAKIRGKSPEETAMDLVVEDGSRVEVAYFVMSEDNIRREVALPWMSFDSDESAPSIEGVFLKSSYHPRAFGNFDRVLAKYVRDEKAVSLPEAIRRLTSFPAETLSLKDRGRLKAGYAADVVVFDPATIQDHATFAKPMQYATGVIDVVVNGKLSLENGEPTAARPGRFVHGRAWTGQPGGGCRASSKDWTWVK